MRDRGRGQEVREEVRTGQRQGDVHALSAQAQVEAHAVHGAAPILGRHVVPAVAPEPDPLAAIRLPDPSFSDGPDEGIVGVEHRRAVRAEPLEDLGLGGGDGLHRIEELQVDGRDHRDHGDVGAREARQRPQLARGRHAQLEHRRRVLGREAKEAQRQPVPIVEVSLGLEDGAARGEKSGRHLLGRGLSRRPRDRHHRHVRRGAHVSSEVGERAGGVFDPHEPQRGRRRHVPVNDGGGRAGRGRGEEEVVAVEARAGDGEEHLSGPDRARVDRHAGEIEAGGTGPQPPARRRRDVLDPERSHGHGRRPHAFRPRRDRPAMSSRAT